MTLLRFGVSWRDLNTSHRDHCDALTRGLQQGSSVKADGKAQLQKWVDTHFLSPISSCSSYPGTLPWLSNTTPPNPCKKMRTSFSVNIAHAYCDPQGGNQVLEEAREHVTFIILQSILDSILLSLRKHWWCSRLSLVPGGATGRWRWGAFTASGEISRDCFSCLVPAFLEIEILSEA